MVTEDGAITITNDGATIMDLMEVQNEVGKLLVDLSKCQDNEIGDGTTGVVVLAGALLEKSVKLIDMGVHPVRIADAFDDACTAAVNHLMEIADKYPIDLNNPQTLYDAAKTSLGSKIVNRYHDHMAKIAADAIISVYDKERNDVDFHYIRHHVKVGGTMQETEIIDGIILDDKWISHPQMPRVVRNAKIAILSCPFEPPKPKTDYTLNIDTAEKLKSLFETELNYFEQQVAYIEAVGANVVVLQFGIDEEANHMLTQKGIMTIPWATATQLESIAIACGGYICGRFEHLTEEKLGSCEIVYEKTFGTNSDKAMYFEKCANSKVKTVLVRGSNEMLVSESKRSLHDAMCVVRNLIKDPAIVYGGGSAEIACSIHVDTLADHQNNINQHAFRAFAEALDVIPLTLASNSGMLPIETLAAVKAEQIADNYPYYGVDCMNKGTRDMKQQKVYECLNSKIQQLTLATQVTRMILKINNTIVHDKTQSQE